MAVRSIWHINNSQTREDTRLAPVGMMTPNSTSALSTYSGVVPTAGDPLKLTSTGPMTAQIEIGRAVVQGQLTQGSYPVVVTAPELLTFPDGDASLPRIDSVMLVVRDDAYDSSGETDVRLMIVQGTPASTPAAPAAPTPACLRLWDVRVPAGASAGGGGINWSTDVTDRRTYTVAVGGIGVGPVPGAYAGQYRDSGGASGVLARYNGSAWESAVRLDNNGKVQIGDTVIRRDSADILATDDVIRVYRPAATDNALSFRTPTDTGASRFFMAADGTMNWGAGGTTATDTNLYRSGVDTLKTDSKFSAEVETIGTTGLAVSTSNWTLVQFIANRTCGVAYVFLELQYIGTGITADSSGNINDTHIATLPTTLAPRGEVYSVFTDGFGDGAATLYTDRRILLRSFSNNASITNGRNYRLSLSYIHA